MKTILNKCKWCGYPYTKTHNRQTYCGENCKRQARQQQNRGHIHTYRQKWGYTNIDLKVGTGTLSHKPHNDWKQEHKAITKELHRLNLLKGWRSKCLRWEWEE